MELWVVIHDKHFQTVLLAPRKDLVLEDFKHDWTIDVHFCMKSVSAMGILMVCRPQKNTFFCPGKKSEIRPESSGDACKGPESMWDTSLETFDVFP